MRTQALLAAILLLGCQNGQEAAEPATTDPSPEVKQSKLQEGEQVKLSAVVKADEVKVTKGGEAFVIRLLGVDDIYREVKEAAVQRAHGEGKTFLQSLIGESVSLHFGKTKTDTRGRTLAYLHHGDIDLSRHLIAHGWVLVYSEFPIKRELPYLMTEQAARREGKGLWQDPKSAKVLLEMRRKWAQARKKRFGDVPDYYLNEPDLNEPAFEK